MDIQQLRQSVKIKWLSYYEQNRSWLVKMRVWGTYNGLRRPSSGFILATLSVLEPQFAQVISFILDLNNNPDQIVAALGLNFNPEQELLLITSEHSPITTQFETESLEEKYTESKPEPLVTVAPKISPAETLTDELPRLHQPVSAYTENPELIPTQKLVSSVAVATKVASVLSAKMVNSAKSPSSLLSQDIPTQKLVSSVAVATKVASVPSAKMVHSAKSPSSLLSQDKPVQSPLAITIDVLNKAKTLPSRKVKDSRFHNVPIKFGTLLLRTHCLTGILFLRECFKSSVQRNGNHGKMPPKPKDMTCKVNRSLSNNNSSLASWVDEFCQGRGYEPEAAISIRL